MVTRSIIPLCRGGRCLIPVFALGRAQELLLILDEYWAAHPELHEIPIYYASSLAKKCMAVYQTFVNAMNEKIRRQIAVNNPFVFKHISNLKGIDHFDDVGPCVVLASPGRSLAKLDRCSSMFQNPALRLKFQNYHALELETHYRQISCSRHDAERPVERAL